MIQKYLKQFAFKFHKQQIKQNTNFLWKTVQTLSLLHLQKHGGSFYPEFSSNRKWKNEPTFFESTEQEEVLIFRASCEFRVQFSGSNYHLMVLINKIKSVYFTVLFTVVVWDLSSMCDHKLLYIPKFNFTASVRRKTSSFLLIFSDLTELRFHTRVIKTHFQPCEDDQHVHIITLWNKTQKA